MHIGYNIWFKTSIVMISIGLIVMIIGRHIHIENHMLTGSIIVGLAILSGLICVRILAKKSNEELKWIQLNGKAHEVFYKNCKIKSRKQDDGDYEHKIIINLSIEGKSIEHESHRSIICSRKRLLKAMKEQIQTYAYYHQETGVYLDISELKRACNLKDSKLSKRILMRFMKV